MVKSSAERFLSIVLLYEFHRIAAIDVNKDVLMICSCVVVQTCVIRGNFCLSVDRTAVTPCHELVTRSDQNILKDHMPRGQSLHHITRDC